LPLSEDTIKKVALAYLKGYYKYRPRGEGNTIARLDMVGEGGIIADGHLTFNKEDGSPFLATFEATSWHTREEVMFHRQPVLLNMDAFAVGMLSATLLLGMLYAEKWPYFEQLGKYSTGLIFLFFMAIVFMVTRLLAARLQRYRYVYAIEQFKQYHADQQWLALGEDVFPDPTDKNFKELKEQCVKQGYGLLMVDPNLKAYLVVTPARLQPEKKRRRIVRFDNAQEWTRQRMEKLKLRTGWRQYLPSVLFDWVNRFDLPDFSLRRYQRSYINQLVIATASLIAAAVMMYDLFKIPPVRYAEDAFVEELEALTQTGRPETGEYLVDTPFIDQFNKTAQTQNPLADDRIVAPKPQPADTVPLAPKELVPGIGDRPPPPEKKRPERAKPSSIDAYDCDRFYGMRGSRYLVLYDMVTNESLAKTKLDTVYDAGIQGGLIWMGCFDEVNSGEFAVYLGILFSSAEEAYSQKTKFEIILQEQGVKFAPLRIRPLVIKG
jgi:hypothetical protein